MRLILLCFLLFFLWNTIPSHASNREDRDIGAYIGLMEPLPSLISLNLGYNFNHTIRGIVGYGFASGGGADARMISVGARFMPPKMTLTPYAQLQWVSASISGTGSVGGFTESTSHIGIGFGFDWQTKGGFFISLGYNVSIKSGATSVPSLNLGWFLDASSLGE